MYNRLLQQRGFTIVELLIVIVIIGILASLVIAAYNGIQDRANNQKTLSAVQAYRKALIQYATINGTYPIIGNGSACLGEPYYANCWSGSNNTSFNNAVRPYLGNANSLPQPSTQSLAYVVNGPLRAGASYISSTTYNLNSVVHPWGIYFIVKGTGQCKLSGVASGPWSNFSSTTPASGHTESQSGNSSCWLPLPNPATL